MNKISKQKLLLATILFAILLISSACTFLPSAHAATISAQQKAGEISKNVIGLDPSYTETIQELSSDSYLGMVPQENLRTTLQLNGSKVDIRYTFVNGSLRILHVLETQGSPRLTKTVTTPLGMAKDFLSSYQSYTGKSLYSDLNSMLDADDAGKNFTKISGNLKLNANASERGETFMWTYIYNGIEAPSKCVSIGYENGFLKYFVDNWGLYTIGSTIVNISENVSKSLAMENAGNFSWRMGNDTNGYEVSNFTVAQAMMTQTVFSNLVSADKARNSDPLTLYPMRCMWVSLDKFYPGNVYGIEVYIWADTGEIGYIHERVSTLDPPTELVASVDSFRVSPLSSLDSSAVATSLNVAALVWLFPVLAFAVFAIFPVLLYLGKKSNLRGHIHFKVGGALLCILLSSLLLLPVLTANAYSPKSCAEIWGAESTGGYDPDIPDSWKYWRKTYNEIQLQRSISGYIEGFFNGNGYATSNSQGSDSMKQYILNDISYNEANYPRVALVDFDHGVGTSTYVNDEWHYMFEDNVGTLIGESTLPNDPLPIHNEHAVTDMDIYPRTATGKPMFAFINTCMSANISDVVSGPFGTYTSTQGIVPNTDRARGLAYAFAHRFPGIDITSDGYYSPDASDFCYIGFPRGSAALDQTITVDTQTINYALWVWKFFEHALDDDMSVIQAMDQASLDWFDGRDFSGTPLHYGFTSTWPMWVYNSTIPGYEWQNKIWPPPGQDKLVVYGNGNIHLCQKGGAWDFNENNGSTAIDALTEENNGTIYGASWTTGRVGSALSFDGNDYVQVPDSESLNIKNALTIQYWVKRTSDSGGYHLLKKDAFGGLKDLGNSLFNFWTYHVGGSDEVQFSTDKMSMNTFHLVTLTWSPGYKSLYVDGTLVEEKTNCRTDDLSQYSTEPIYIGNSQGWHANNFGGVIDEVRIYNYVLSPTQIADDAAVAVYHLNDGNAYDPHGLNGDDAYDSSPYRNDGSLYGASWATGVRGSAVDFDGSNDYMSSSVSGLGSGNTPHSLSAWLKVNSLPNNRAWILLLGNAGLGAHHWLINSQGDTQFGRWQSGDNVTGQTNPSIPVGEWVHVAVTFNGSVICCFVNGVLVDSDAADFNVGSSFSIGQGLYGDNYFDGVVDEVRIYDRALSTTEIANYYDSTLPYHWITVMAVSDYTPLPLYAWIKIGGIEGYESITSYVSQGPQTVEVQAYDIYDPYAGWLYFDHFEYGVLSNSSNPMSLQIKSQTEVLAVYNP